MRRWVWFVLFAFLLLTFGLFVWPGPYRYFDYNGIPMRENRFTHKIEVLKREGLGEVFNWRDVSTPTAPTRWYTEEQEKKAFEAIEARGGYKDKGEGNYSYLMRKNELEGEIVGQDPRYKKMLEEAGLDEKGNLTPRK